MKIGIPKEIKTNEERVSLTPGAVQRLTSEGHEVFVEKSAGLGAGYTDEEYAAQGAKIVNSHEEIFEISEMIVKVKEPLESEYHLLREGQILFTYLHLAASRELTEAILKTGVIGIAYETVQTPDGDLPLLAPMSEIAGRMAPMVANQYLMKPHGKRGVLICGVPGVPEAQVTIIGLGHVGLNAARIALGLGARVTAIDKNPAKLRYAQDLFRGANLTTMSSDPQNLKQALKYSDIVILSVLTPGAKAPIVITRDMLKLMKPGSVIVDVSIDQGGAAETSKPTTHIDPVYEVDGIIHYCVANMPGAVPRTSTRALTMVTIDYVSELAAKGWKRAVLENQALARGVNVAYGYVTHPAVAQTFNMEYTPLNRI
ncbi:MAG: alanine dehydrogenase [Actinobacteria bacterium]|nr:alanine dehydrogenase [Actinomycetota bacterium]